MNSICNFPVKINKDELYSWAKQAFYKGQLCKKVVGNGSPEDIVILAVYRNWLSIQGAKDFRSIQLGSLLAREVELYAQNDKGKWKLVHPFYQYSLPLVNTAKRAVKAEQLELFAR